MASGIESAILLFAVLLLAALLLDPLARRLRLPVAAILVMAGFLGSELAVGLGYDLGLRWHHFHDLVLFVLMPVLVFGAAIAIPPQALLRQMPLILLLSLPLFLLSAAFIAALLYFAIDHPTGFPWLTALVVGVIVAATDPAAVISLLHRSGVPERLVLLLEGESLFNDATAIVAFGVLLTVALAPTTEWTLSAISWNFITVFFGGLAVGMLLGLIAYGLMRFLTDKRYPAVLSVAAAYLAFSIAETLLHVSGVMAVLVTGLWVGAALRSAKAGDDFVRQLWSFLVLIAESLAFLLIGITITVSLFTELWYAMLLGIGVALIGRAAGITLLTPLLDRYDRNLLIGGGLRGAVTAALALSLPIELEGWWTAQAAAYAVVIFTLFVQAPLFGIWVTKRWGEKP